MENAPKAICQIIMTQIYYLNLIKQYTFRQNIGIFYQFHRDHHFQVRLQV